MSPNPRDPGSCPSSVIALKGDLQPFFFFFNWAKERCLALPAPLLGGLGRSSRPSPSAGASTSTLAIFTHEDHERASDLPQGTLPLGGAQSPASVPRVPVRLRSGCVPAVSRLRPGCFSSVSAAAAGEEGFGGAAYGEIEKEN